MHRWTEGSLAKHLSNFQARYYDQPEEPLGALWSEADLVEGLTNALRSLIDAVEDQALKEREDYRVVEAVAKFATDVCEAAEQWSVEEGK